MNWIRRKVQAGVPETGQVGLPTLNLKVGDFGQVFSAGLYGCELETGGKIQKAALYFGPRLGTGKMALEIYGSDLRRVGQGIRFRILGKIRNAMEFGDLSEIKNQVERDLQVIATKGAGLIESQNFS